MSDKPWEEYGRTEVEYLRDNLRWTKISLKATEKALVKWITKHAALQELMLSKYGFKEDLNDET